MFVCFPVCPCLPLSPNLNLGFASLSLCSQDPLNRKLLAKHMASFLVSFEEAENGSVAIAKVQQAAEAGTPYDLVFMVKG